MSDEHDDFVLGFIILFLLVLFIGGGVWWVWHAVSYVKVPDVIGQTLAEAEETFRRTEYADQATSMQDRMKCDFFKDTDIVVPTCEDVGVTSWNYEELIITKQSPKSGTYRKKDLSYLQVTVKPTEEYEKELLAKYQEKEKKERELQDSLKKSQIELDNLDAALSINETILPYGEPLVSDKLQAISSTGYQPIFVVSDYLDDLQAIAATSNVTDQVLANPQNWYITDRISYKNVDSINHKMWIAVNLVSSKLNDPVNDMGQLQRSQGDSGYAYYENCKDVWNALGHGITSDDPGYSYDLDSDRDGRACELPPDY